MTPLANAQTSTSQVLAGNATWLRRHGNYDVYRVGQGRFEFSSSPATLGSLSQIVTTFTAQGKISIFGAIQLQVRIALAAILALTGHKPEAITQLEGFKRTVSDPRVVNDPIARDTLIRETEAVIASLRTTG